MWVTWTLAVLSVMKSASPISRFVLPRATRSSTSRSRAVRPWGSTAGWDAAGAGPRASDARPILARLASPSIRSRSGRRRQLERDGMRVAKRSSGPVPVRATGQQRLAFPKTGECRIGPLARGVEGHGQGAPGVGDGSPLQPRELGTAERDEDPEAGDSGSGGSRPPARPSP